MTTAAPFSPHSAGPGPSVFSRPFAAVPVFFLVFLFLSAPRSQDIITITHPLPGQAFSIGDTLDIQWTSQGDVLAVDIYFSPDNGVRTIGLTRNSITFFDDSWENYSWVIPASLIDPRDSADINLASAMECLIIIREYNGYAPPDTMDGTFSISENPVIPRPVFQEAGVPGISVSMPYININTSSTDPQAVEIFSSSGRLMLSSIYSAARPKVDAGALVPGFYIVSTAERTFRVLIK